ncbi:MAG: hypothetical protein E7266_09055 [Lachnospiraceae bacterium]|nr:hypothetical protein [Lachnospiraceae bacterium]
MLDSEKIFESMNGIDSDIILRSEKRENKSKFVKTVPFVLVCGVAALMCLALITGNKTNVVSDNDYQQGGGNAIIETTENNIGALYAVIEYQDVIYTYQDKYEDSDTNLIIVEEEYYFGEDYMICATIYRIDYDTGRNIIVKFRECEGYYVYSAQ